VVWKEFAGDRKQLAVVAGAIKAGYKAPEAVAAAGADEDDAEEFPEGRVLYRLHRARERSQALREKAKALALREYGKLECRVCGFDFAAKYGKLGEGFIECHHTVPLSDLAEQRKTRVEDVAMLCANWHRMVHRKRPWLAIDALRSVLVGSVVLPSGS
jgi:5-methylcytosine-specific restriction protein A